MTKTLIPRELGRVGVLWSNGLREAFDEYLEPAGRLGTHLQEQVALAAALVESGLTIQRLGAPAPAPAAELLLGDLCLSRASRLLVDTDHEALQIAFARAVEKLAAAAAEGKPVVPRAALLEAI